MLPVPPTPGPALQGELGVSPAGGEPTGPQQACTPLGGGGGGRFPNTGLSLLPSLLLLLLLPVPVSHFISDSQSLDQHLSTTLSAPVSRLISACQLLEEITSVVPLSQEPLH